MGVAVPTVTADSCISPCSCLGFCLLYFDALFLGACVLWIVMSSPMVTSYHYVRFLFIPDKLSALKSVSTDNIATPAFLWLMFAWYIFSIFYTFSLCLYISGGYFHLHCLSEKFKKRGTYFYLHIFHISCSWLPMCRSIFPSGIIFILPDRLSLMFLIVLVCWWWYF